MRAAVLHEIGQEKLEVLDDVEAVGFGPGKVKLRIRATGLCHSDVSAMSGVLPQPAPFIPGHEGAGEVVDVGDGVTGLSAGDRVLVCWLPACGECPSCKRGQTQLCLAGFMNAGTPNFKRPGGDVFGFAGTGTFTEEVVVGAGCAVPIPDDVPFEIAALIGCGVTTGLGAAINTAQVEAGSSVAVIGCGGVGISTIQGARVRGAAQIVAVDPVASRREAALRFGATEAVAPGELADAKQRITGGEGFDYVFEVVGKSATARTAYETTRRGGTLCVVGAGAMDDTFQVNMFELFFDEKRILPSMYGGGDVLRSYERAIALWRAGRIDLESMITHRVRLDGINDALDQMRTGEALRTCIEL
ncbi:MULTISPECIES: Zn-dependent alcohol dehydrogenase [Streptomyces]|uniref:Zn-dependent alcohol dehydrogenase n=1 Tax=Streptomyces TaxID=1883 RepID=UPI00051790BE|nr:MULTISPECIES: Zn-dependent alcohol dehydrogenase [Streptomyces]WDT91432.1 Zn-dependent alcohol dehydrogenase [Streptomyces sp. SCSIO-PteL053]MCQ1580882.1 Zn-dependent alcohol dehydrogenase [Streptomyces parvus]MYX03529.1 zinc-binding dehydrogenase [Streptomyces sp. SID8378]SCF80614.1 S-(hydroxymethyl)glutathione dehydrogenase / alcohol dehydrogenase [Streptomyces sp. Cmuel-A718b]SNB84841.1 S-(hydroxymethyl)glutathione dehydrogenase / alcohol dehydrogenase [Streptomyces sp. PgraA7]